MKTSLIMHINHAEQGQSLGEACALAARLGFDGIEFRRRRPGVAEDPAQYLDTIEKAVRDSGLREVLFGYPGPDLTPGDADRRRREVEEAAVFYREARRRFGTALCNTFAGDLRNPDLGVPANDWMRQGSGCATDELWERAIEGFRTLAPAMEEAGMRLAFETHPCYLHDQLAPTKRLVEAIGSPAVGVALDYANFLLYPKPPSPREVATALGAKVFYLHLKNLVLPPCGGYVMTPLADGCVNHRELLRELGAAGFAGPICIESPRPGDRAWFAREDLGYLRILLEELRG